MYHHNFYTVESVTSGHPDKVCDQISDGILDACLEQDPVSRVAMETFGAHGTLVIGGELTTKAEVDFKSLAAKIYREIGYREKLEIITRIVRQSPDISQGVDTGGAGDQGIMYGYAISGTKEYLPKGVVLVHRIIRRLEKLRRTKKIPWLMPDGKAQVTIDRGRVKTVLVSTQYRAGTSPEDIRQTLIKQLIVPIIGSLKRIEVLINPTGQFVVGGFAADTGLTGRKIMVDTYGGLIPHGGGCFSGKDPTKVDRSGAYMARFAAKNIVANGMAKDCLVSVAYAIGRTDPVMLTAVDENGDNISDLVKLNFDFRPKAIIERLDLRRPIFFNTAVGGHFGRPGFSWEKIVKLKS
ncbi:MAG: methionine adenosyltransferase [Patescibacteria group bacterium]|nr:methionine adenosyltransferase [Patescibacteria group bacterium]